MRAPGARRHGAGDRLQRRSRPPRRSAFERQGFAYLHVVDLDGAFAGEPMNARGGRAHPRRHVACRCSSAAASATCAPSRAGWRRASPRVIIGTAAVQRPRFRARGGAALSRPDRGRHRRARRPGRGRGLGADSRTCRRSTSAAGSRTPASPRSSTPTSPATASCRGSTSRRRWRSPRRWRSRSSPRAASPRSRTSSACSSPIARGSPARSPAARSTTAGSTRPKRWR